MVRNESTTEAQRREKEQERQLNEKRNAQNNRNTLFMLKKQQTKKPE